MPTPPRVYAQSRTRLAIYVPTKGRLDKQLTMQSFCLEELSVRHNPTYRVYFVVPEVERRLFTKKYPWARVAMVPDNVKTGSINEAIKFFDPQVPRKVIIDDDLTLQRRRDSLSVSQRDSATQGITDTLALLQRIEAYFDSGYVHGGISMSNANHYCVNAFSQENTRACGFLFFDANILRKESVCFDAVQEHQALHYTLALLELGYKNVVDYEFMFGHKGTNASGGCSSYRTVDYLESQNRLLQMLHPKGVQLFYRKLKGEGAQAITGPNGIPAVKIAWKKSINTRSQERAIKDKELQKQGIQLCSG